MSRVVASGRFGVRALGVALVLLAAGLFVPQMVDATTSSGERAIFEPLAPARILDTRFGPSPLPIGTPLGVGATMEIPVRGVGGVPTDATAVVLNVTVTSPTAASFLTVFPAGVATPSTSSLNFAVGATIPNAVTVKIGTNGKVAIRNDTGTVQVIADVNGFYRGHDHDDRYDTKAQVDAKITAAQAVVNSVGSSQIADGSVGNADLGGSSVNGAKIADGSVGNADLGGSSVDGAKIADGSVGNADLGGSSVDGGKVLDGSLTLADLRTTVTTSQQSFAFTLVPGGCVHYATDATGLPLGAPASVEFASGAALPANVVLTGGSVVHVPNIATPQVMFDLCSIALTGSIAVTGTRSFTVTVFG